MTAGRGRREPAHGARSLTCSSCGAALQAAERACRSCGVTLLTRRCASCFDLSLAGDRNCRRCGVLLPEEAGGASDVRSCAACGAAMVRRRAASPEFEECDRCGSLWLSTQAPEQVATSAETRSLLRAFDHAAAEGAPPPDRAEVVYRKCPTCSKMMNRRSFALGSGVVLDVCREHGAHFDRGELTRIVAFIEGGGLERARRREAESLKHEVSEARRQKALAARADGGAEIDLRPSDGPGALDLLRFIAGRWFGSS